MGAGSGRRAAWRGDDMPLLDYLRKSNQKDGGIHQWVKKRFAKEKQEGESLEAFARRCTPRGEKMISADMVSRKNDKFYGQWLALHVPFRSFAEFHVDDIAARRTAVMLGGGRGGFFF